MAQYNPMGGTSQNVINAYHQQMADIDAQLYKTGEYTGPCPDPKTGLIENKTLNRRQAMALKQYLWEQADKLEGYSIPDRHYKNIFARIGASILRGLRNLWLPYRIRAFFASRHQPQNDLLNILYDNQGTVPPATEPKTPEKPKEKEKVIAPKEPVKGPKEKPDPVVIIPDPVIEEPKELNDDRPAKPNYKELFYKALDEKVAAGISREGAILELLKEEPHRVFDLNAEDITQNIAAQAVRGMAEAKNQPPRQVFINLTKKIPQIAKINTREEEFKDLFKVIPTVVRLNPETLQHFAPNQMTKKTVEFVLKDIRAHSEPDMVEQNIKDFKETVAQIQSPAAQKVMEHLDALILPDLVAPEIPVPPPVAPVMPVPAPVAPAPAPVPPVMPVPVAPVAPSPAPLPVPPIEPTPIPAPVEHSWQDDPKVVEAFSDAWNGHCDFIMCYPEEMRESIALEKAIELHPEIYPKVPEEEITASIAGMMIIKDLSNLIDIPERIPMEEIIPEVRYRAECLEPDEIQDLIDRASASEKIPDEIQDLIAELEDVKSNILNAPTRDEYERE